MYKVSVYDQTAQVALPDTYTASTAVEIGELNTDTHEYIIGVSASACIGGGFGDATITNYRPGIIIIVDVIVQMNCPGPGQSLPPNGSSQQFNLPFNNSDEDFIQTKRIRVTSNFNQNYGYVDFLIWVDCFQQFRFYEIEAQGAKRTPVGNAIKYAFINNSAPFFDLASGSCDIGMCSVSLKYHVPCLVAHGACTIQNTPESCGEKFSASPAHLLVRPGGSSPYATEAKEKMEPKGLQRNDRLQTYLKAGPNPFSDAVNIQYDLESPGLVSIDLFNATGAVVRNIVSPQWLESGAYTTLLTLQDRLPNGPYFLVLQVGSKRFVTPLIKQ